MTTAPAKAVTAVTTDTLRLALRPADAEVLEFITKSPDDCLQYRKSDGSIDLDGVREMMVDIERKKILDDHPFSISPQVLPWSWGLAVSALTCRKQGV